MFRGIGYSQDMVTRIWSRASRLWVSFCGVPKEDEQLWGSILDPSMYESLHMGLLLYAPKNVNPHVSDMHRSTNFWKFSKP